MTPELFFEYESYYNEGQTYCNDHGARVKRFKLVDNEGVTHEFVSEGDHTYYFIRENSAFVFIARPLAEQTSVVSGNVDLNLIPESQYHLPGRTIENGEYNGLGCYSIRQSANPIILVDEEYNEIGFYLYFSDNGLEVRSDPTDSSSVLAAFDFPQYDLSNRVTPFTGYALKAKYHIFDDTLNSSGTARTTDGAFGSSFDVLVNEVGDDFEDLYGADLRKTYEFKFEASTQMGGDFNSCDLFYIKDGDDVFEYDKSWWDNWDGPYKMEVFSSTDGNNEDKHLEYAVYGPSRTGSKQKELIQLSPRSNTYACHPEVVISVSNDGYVCYDSNDESALLENGPLSYSESVSNIDSVTYTSALKNGTYFLVVRCAKYVRDDSLLGSYLGAYQGSVDDILNGVETEFSGNSFANKLYKIVVDSTDTVAPIKIMVYRPRLFTDRISNYYFLKESSNSAYTIYKTFSRTTFGDGFVAFLDENNKILDDTYHGVDDSLVYKEWICTKVLYKKSANVTLNVDTSNGLASQDSWNEALRTLILEGDVYLYDVPPKTEYRIIANDGVGGVDVVENQAYHITYDGKTHKFAVESKTEDQFETVDSSNVKWLNLSSLYYDLTHAADDDALLSSLLYDDTYKSIADSRQQHGSFILSNHSVSLTVMDSVSYRTVTEAETFIAVYNNEIVECFTITVDPKQLVFNPGAFDSLDISSVDKVYDGTTDIVLPITTIDSDTLAEMMSDSICGSDTIQTIKLNSAYPHAHAGSYDDIPIVFSWDDASMRNYTLPETEYVSGKITQRQVFYSGEVNATKEYDGTTGCGPVSLAVDSLISVVEADQGKIRLLGSVDCSSSKNSGARFSSPDIGSTGQIYVDFIVASDVVDSDDFNIADNYKAPESKYVTTSIVQRHLTMSGSSATKEYNRLSAVRENDFTYGTLSNIVGNDDVSVSLDPDNLPTTSYPDIGSYVVSVNYILSGEDAYKYSPPIEDVTVNIVKLVVTGIKPEFNEYSKTYDGTHFFNHYIDKVTIYTEFYPEGRTGYCHNPNLLNSPVYYRNDSYGTAYVLEDDWEGASPVLDAIFFTVWFCVNNGPTLSGDVGEYGCTYIWQYALKSGSGMKWVNPGGLTDDGIYDSNCVIDHSNDIHIDDSVKLTITPKQLYTTNSKKITKEYDGKNGDDANISMYSFEVTGQIDPDEPHVTASFATPSESDVVPGRYSEFLGYSFHNNEFSTMNVHDKDLFFVEYSVSDRNYLPPVSEYVPGEITALPLNTSFALQKYFDLKSGIPNRDPSYYGVIEGDDVSIECTLTNSYNKEFKPFGGGSNPDITAHFELSGNDAGNYTIEDVTGTYVVAPNYIKSMTLLPSLPIQKIYDGACGVSSNLVQGYKFEFGLSNDGSPLTFCAYRFKNGDYSTPGYSNTNVYAIGTLDSNGEVVLTANRYVYIIPYTHDADNRKKRKKDVGLYSGTAIIQWGAILNNNFNYQTIHDLDTGKNPVVDLQKPDSSIRIEGMEFELGDDCFKICHKQLEVSGTYVEKDYDKTTNASDNMVSLGTVSGFVGLESFEISPHVEGNYSGVNVGDDYSISVSYYVSSDPNGYSSNYLLPPSSSVQGIINPKQLTIKGTINADKYYDGTSEAYPTFEILGIIDGDDVTVIGSGWFSSHDVGSYWVLVSYSLVGEQAGNYIAPPNETTTIKASIYKAPIEFVFGSNSYTKEYDATSSFGTIVNDSYIRIDNHLNLNAYKLDGTDYYVRGELVEENGTRQVINRTGEIYRVIFDAVDNEHIPSSSVGSYGVGYKLIPGLMIDNTPQFYEVLSDYPRTPSFQDCYDSPALSTIYLTDTIFQITPRTLTVGAITPTTVTRNYMGKTLSSENSVISIGDVSGFQGDDEEKVEISCAVVGDLIDINGLGGNVGFYSVTVNYTLSHRITEENTTEEAPDLQNYIVNPQTVTATITRKTVTISDVTADKIYDGTTNANVVIGTKTGFVDGDDVDVYVSFVPSFASSDVGTYTLNPTYRLTGVDANNYSLKIPDMFVVGVTATISPAKVEAVPHSVSGRTIVYDSFPQINSLVTEYTIRLETGEEFVVVRMDETNSDYYVEAESNTNEANRRVFKIDSFTTEDNIRSSNVDVFSEIESYVVVGRYSQQTESFIPSQNYRSSTSYAYASAAVGTNIWRQPTPITINTLTANKQWDGSARVFPTFEYFGVIGDDDVHVNITATDFSSSEIGTESDITLTYSLSGEQARNYSIITENPITMTARIAPRQVTVSEPFALYE